MMVVLPHPVGALHDRERVAEVDADGPAPAALVVIAARPALVRGWERANTRDEQRSSVAI
jgi:hypothetical protein